MLTKKDISQLKEIFVTKEEFYSTMQKFSDQIIEVMTITMRSMIDELRVEIKTEFAKYRRDTGDILENHERRIDKLEDKVFN